MTPVGPPARRLLVRDLAQLATPVGGEAPLHGRALAEVRVVEDAYILVEGEAIVAAGPMAELPPSTGEVEHLDGARRLPYPSGVRR